MRARGVRIGPPRASSRRSALEQDVVGRVALRLALTRRRRRPRVDDQLVARLEDDGLLVRHVDALAGERVLVIASGPGWRVVTDGQALGAGMEGSPVRVRVDSGRMLQGRAVADRQVEVLL